MIADLVRQAQRGEAEAYTQLVRKFQDAVYATAYQLVLDSEAARDLAQETFVRGYQGLGNLRRPESFPAWIVRIARNLATDWLRQPERRWVPLDDSAPADRDVASEVAARDLVHRALATLPDDNRLALSLFLVNGYTYQEVAQLTDAPLSTVKGRIERAKGKLAREVFAMVEDTLKSGAPDEQFTLETVKESLKRGWEAARGDDLATSRAVAEKALNAVAGDNRPEAADLRMDALGLVARSTFFADKARWREAVQQMAHLADDQGDTRTRVLQLYHLAMEDQAMSEEEREQAVLAILDLFRDAGDAVRLAQALFFRGMGFVHRGDPVRGFATLREARDEIAHEPYGAWHACLDAAAEFERLCGADCDVTRRVVWGAGCNVLKLEDDRLVFAGQPGSSWSNGSQAETAKFASPFILWQTHWFPYISPAPGYEDEQVAFSATPHPTYLHLWIETDGAEVSTPAGRFTGCLLLRITQTESPLDAQSDHPQRRVNKIWCGEKWVWFARGVGPVAYRAERADGIVEHTMLSKFHCPEQREEWVPLVVGTRWEYVPAEPAEEFDALMVEWLSHRGEDGTWYQPHVSIGNRR